MLMRDLVTTFLLELTAYPAMFAISKFARTITIGSTTN